MREVEIGKRSGGTRRIVAVSPDERDTLRAFLPALDRAQEAADRGNDAAHGFRRGRSPLTGARIIARAIRDGATHVLEVDLENFFDSIDAARHLVALPRDLLREYPDGILFRGGTPQGFPTSPAAANVAAASVDAAIRKWLKKNAVMSAYVRYADDMTIAFAGVQPAKVIEAVHQITRRTGFSLNPKKTRWYNTECGRVPVLGLAVDDSGVHLPRRTRRKLRAAWHVATTATCPTRWRDPSCRCDQHRAARSAAGLLSWGALRPPAPRRAVEEEVRRLCRHWRLRRPSIPTRDPDVWIAEDVVITGDPVYLLAPSDFTTDWRSCLAHRAPAGGWHTGTPWLVACRGIYIAAVLSRRETTYAGVARRAMAARALVFRLRNGGWAYQPQLYGDDHAHSRLRRLLGARGMMPLRRDGGVARRVVGHVPTVFALPYNDPGMRFSRGTCSASCQCGTVRYLTVRV